MQGTRPAAVVRPRAAGQRHQARAAVHGSGIVHVVRERADRGNLSETGLGAVPAAVHVALRVRRPVGGTATGARGRGADRVQPRVRRRFRVLRVAEKRVLLRPRRPPEPDVRVSVHARVAGRTGQGHGEPDARGRGRHDDDHVHHGDGRPDGPVPVRVLDDGRRVGGPRRHAGPGHRHALPVAGHRATGGLRVLDAPPTVHVRIVPERHGARGVHGARHERDAGPPGLRVRGRIRVRQGHGGGPGRVPRRPRRPAAARPGRRDLAGRRRERRPVRVKEQTAQTVRLRLRRFPVAHRAGHGRQQHAAHRRLRVHEAARLRDTAAPVAHQLVHVPYPEPADRVHRAGRRAESRPGHMPVRHRGDQLQRPRLVPGVLGRLDRTADRRPTAAAQLQDHGRRVPRTRVRLIHRHLDGSVQDAAHHVLHQRVRHAVQREPRLHLQVSSNNMSIFLVINVICRISREIAAEHPMRYRRHCEFF